MKKIISMLLVLAMMITVLTVGIATTSAAETATITIYGLDGTTEVKEINVGDEFTVYTTLDVSDSVVDSMVSSVQGTQTYSSDVLQLCDGFDANSGEINDLMKVFPVTCDATVSNASQAGKILYAASAPSIGNAFKFDSAYSKLIVTTYKVKAAGTGEVKNALKNLAAADSDMTKIIFEGELQTGKSIDGTASFDDPAPEIENAVVTLHKLDGTTEVKEFNVGETFTVYTMLNASSVNGGKLTSVNGTQRFTSSILQLQDAVDDENYISDLTTVFPIMGNNALASVSEGAVKYSGSSYAGFLFSSDNSQLITTTYKVTAPGFADITNTINTLAAVEDDVIVIVFNGDTQDGVNFTLPASFYPPGEAPTLPPATQAPATQAPVTEAPVTETPTEAPTKLNVTIINPDNTTVQKAFSVNETFTVYTVLNAGGTIASVDGTQTFTAAALQLTDAVTGEYNEISNKTAMFPILGDEAVATANNGVIKFNATRGTVNGGYAFDTAASKLIVTNYKVLATGEATIKTSLKTLIKDDADATKIVYNSTTQEGQSYTMPGSFTDPAVEPTQPPVTEPPVTEPPVTEPPATEPPATEPPATEPPADQAVVTIYGLDGSSVSNTYGIGETFTVYTTFDPTAWGFHGIASISASQTFTGSVLQSTDETVNGVVTTAAAAEMFPVLGANTVAKITNENGAGLNKYNASVPGVGSGFVFDEENPLLIVTNYQVIAAGNAEVRNSITTLAADNMELTRVVNKGVVADGYELVGIASFTDPTVEPTEPPVTEPPVTEPPVTEPPATEPPATEPPATEPATQPATEPPVTTATITIYGIDGTSETKTCNIGDTFTVYTTFNAGDTTIASVNANQTFTSSVLAETDAVDASGIVADTAAMFPVFGDKVMARITAGMVKYNASTATIGDGFAFDAQNPLLIVTNYRVIAGGTAEIRNSLTTIAAADEDLTRIVDEGVVAPGKEVSGIASFTDPTPPATEPATEAPTEAPATQPATTAPAPRYYLLGDANDDDAVESVDCTVIQKALAWLPLPVDQEIVERNGDVNMDGDLETIDVTLIQKYLAWLPVDYPIDEYIEING